MTLNDNELNKILDKMMLELARYFKEVREIEKEIAAGEVEIPEELDKKLRTITEKYMNENEDIRNY